VNWIWPCGGERTAWGRDGTKAAEDELRVAGRGGGRGVSGLREMSSGGIGELRASPFVIELVGAAGATRGVTRCLMAATRYEHDDGNLEVGAVARSAGRR
jgi:hypothetical protein